jgi:hypothetical protein
MIIGVTIADMIDDSTVKRLKLLGVRGGGRDIPAVQSTKMVPYTLRTRFQFGLSSNPSGGPSGQSRVDVPLLKRGHFELQYEEKTLLDWYVTLAPTTVRGPLGDIGYHLHLPAAYFKTLGMQTIDVDVGGEEKYVTVATYLKGLLPQGVVARDKQGAQARKTVKTVKRRRLYSIWPIPWPISGSLSHFQRALAQIHYLGPLRSAAERYYVAESGRDPGMDSSGEFLPYVLRDKGDSQVQYCLPGSSDNVSDSLSVALDTWLSYLRTGRAQTRSFTTGEISLETTKGVLVELSIRSLSGKESHALADSGFGYSQVLPIIARGLLAPPGSTLIVEQPELHLNPALQVRLAEFFVSMARSNKQVLVETHSEHILNAMRVLTAESERPFECGVYFVDVAMGKPNIRPLSVSPDGTVAGWPPDFFGEASELRARLLRAQTRFLGSER